MIYLASSWKNTDRIDETRNVLRGIGKEVYDFREDMAFHWSEVHADIQQGAGDVAETKAADFIRFLESPLCHAGYTRDMSHLEAASMLVCILPCGKSAHLELGFAIAKGIPTAIYLSDMMQPELMYKGADLITADLSDIMLWAV